MTAPIIGALERIGAKTLLKGGEKLAGRAGARKAEENVIEGEVVSETVDGVTRKVAPKAKSPIGKGLKNGLKKGAKVAGPVGLGLVGLDLLNAVRDGSAKDFVGEVGRGLGDLADTLIGDPFSALKGGINGEETIEFDPDVMNEFIGELRHAADSLSGVVPSFKKAVDAEVQKLSKSPLGNATRDGKPSPVFNDYIAVLAETEKHLVAVVNDLHTQLVGDAARLESILHAQMETTKDAANKLHNIETSGIAV